MTLAIVLIGLALYLGLAMVVGRFCGINSAWDRVVERAMKERPEPKEPDLESARVQELDGTEPGLEETPSERQERSAEAQLV
jgi:hypothetical protein